MLERKDRVKEITTTTGTGTVNLGGAVNGFRTFISCVTSGATVRYFIETGDLSEWEVGEGIFTDGTPDTLSRVTIYASSNAGSLVDFSAGNKNVALSLVASDMTPATGAEINTGTDDDKFVTAKAIADSYIENVYYGMARQAIINGNFDVWQRSASTTNPVENAFVTDRWKVRMFVDGGTPPTVIHSAQQFTPGELPSARWFYRVNPNGAGTSLGVNSYGFIAQYIENGVSKLCGLDRKVTVSFWARSSIAGKRFVPNLQQSYGTGGSPTATETILGTPITLTSTLTKYTVTFTTNTLVGKTFGTNGDDALILNLWYMWGSTIGNGAVQAGITAETYVGSGNIDIAQVQLCSGDVALPFQPKSFEEELRACQRYYEKSYNYATAPATVTQNGGFHSGIYTSWILSCGTVRFKVEKRSAPTVTRFSTNNGATTVGAEYNPAGIFVANRSINANENATSGFVMGGADGTFVAGNTIRFHWTADAEL